MQLELNFNNNKLKCEFTKNGRGKTHCPYVTGKLVGTIGCTRKCEYFVKIDEMNYVICNYQRK